MKCDFCEILRNNEYEIYQDELITVLLDYDPISKGHILILPNDHYLDLDEMPDELVAYFFFAKKYVRILKEKFDPKGYSMMQNGGEFNDIKHFHLHVFPRFNKEEFGWTYAEEVESSAIDFSKLKEILRNDLKKIKM